jgi:hypothetical protein
MTYLFAMDETNAQLRQKQVDRRIGYLIFAGIFIIGLTVLFLGVFHLKNKEKTKAVSFDQIGNLKIDDPVYLLGTPIGNIKTIELRERSVLVFLTIHKPLNLHKGYNVDDIEIGFMGDRLIAMDFGDTALPLVPEQDTLQGTFHAGISEEIGMTWKLKGVIDSFVALSASLLHNGPLRASFVQQVNKIAAVTDSMSLMLATMITRLGSRFPARLDSLNRIIGSVSHFSHCADSLTQKEIPGLTKQIGVIGGELSKLESTLDALLVTAEKFESKEGTGDQHALLAFIVKMKVLRDAAIHVKEGLSQLSKLAIQ